MIFPVFLNFVAIATAYLSKNSKKVVPLIYTSSAYTLSVKIDESMS